MRQASTHEDLEAVVNRYMYDTWLGRALYTEHRGLRPHLPGTTLIPLLPFDFVMSPDLDPQGEERLRVYALAVRQRIAAAPEIRTSPLAEPYADALLPEEVERRPGPCRTRHVSRLGGHPRHDQFARHVTGSDQDFRIETPEGIACTTDGLDPHNQTWEVKTGYRYFSETNIIWSPDVPRFSALIGQLEEQRARCLYVTSRCGYPYAYAFDNEEVARFMQDMWDIPPVFFINPPY